MPAAKTFAVEVLSPLVALAMGCVGLAALLGM